MPSASIARRDLQIERSRGSAALARVKANTSAQVEKARAKARATVTRLRESKRTQMTLGAGFAALGGVGAGQVAKMSILPDGAGVSRSHLVNYAAGAAGVAALVTGAANTQETMALAAVGIGMAVGQLAITSYLEWDLLPDWGGE